ncbi:MAG: phosphatidylglycerophosphatase A [Calditrichaeota bacterium]|nr:MAG: phosphatidylglycerophosphatase A [Calditrichota bacterium]MBL1206836.1 phosphatidylglycerophosphatase A [Calditrichota bacterium]NOG46663.1 phosphatidylglycerophosphatase A [Calditrichota bacterium]
MAHLEKDKKEKNLFAFAIGSVGGIGYFPKAPGTFASAIAALLYFLINPEVYALTIGIIAAFILGIVFSDQVEKHSGKDPGFVVIDEFAGQWITFLLLPESTVIIIISGFILFRFFDILKPLGINRLQEFKSGWGIMLDDVLAGIYANIILQVLIYYGVFR